jgi:predicted phosphate transport protein (TIGR00153 family)
MERIKNIFAWEASKKSKSPESMIIEHLKKTQECVFEMHNSIGSIVQNDSANIDKSIEGARKAEEDGDELKKTIMAKLAEGKCLLMSNKAELILLSEKVNDISDNSKEVVRLLEFIEKDCMENLAEMLLENSRIALNAAAKLNTAANSLFNNEIQVVLAECALIEILENEGDDNRRLLINLLIRKNLNPQMTILIYELIDSLEDVIDSIKNAAETVRILAIKRQ